ncbi:diphosphomevalonate decarboxylase [Paucilactobacillus oligofermentans DSM 15707 = LMG 22743]|uniref:diphosphomevalonate decarboxylase n=1 Tax=Paucilactobacillus oligofermentans DSM 15707 = LMG 22743 TaxID=1423778 RepID=A0A0R1RCT7_9LACO|nr:diphosphomevalonate decarboxylase [Paucilactobacillus oligofermentans DSM 15707 = LMG 22743]CUS26205.1 Diphosphomevalonate decarboxylase [Paucilactobacillus oligofermentans DSM 15707 = LMG 22743]
MTDLIATAKAHTNIALVKYWGKRDETLILPWTDSLSLTLNEFYTTTKVTFSETLEHDNFYIDRILVDQKNNQKLTNFMNVAREKIGLTYFANVESFNCVPISAGLASSSSAFAALAGAIYEASGVDYTLNDVSKLARRGSGSATRSVFGGLAEWKKGSTDDDSYAQPIQETVDFGIEMIAILLDTTKKKVSSRLGMQTTVDTSPFFNEWVKVVEKDMQIMHQAIEKKDINLIGEIAESNAMRMHSLTLSASPSFTYFNADSLLAMQEVEKLRTNGVKCFYTMDAGPNVKVIYDRKNRETILQELSKVFGRDRLVVSQPGPGIEFIK